MYTVTIYDKSQKLFKPYKHIKEIKFFDSILDEWVSLSDSELLSHSFLSDSCSRYHLLSNGGNYAIDSSLIGIFEVEKED